MWLCNRNINYMKKCFTILIWVLEFSIVIVLIWRLFRLPDLTVPILLLVSSPFLALAHWIALKKKHLSKRTMLTLFFLTGPCIILSMSLILDRSLKLTTSAMLDGGISKEEVEQAEKEEVPNECLHQWHKGNIESMKVELLLCAMLLATLIILYREHCLASRNQSVDNIDLESGGQPLIQ